ncbi:Insulinase (Peptidase M16), partial [Ascosphaera acerosa]
KASAAVDVNVGSFSDPEDLQGLAHCLEHALFMGTQKYPQENAYSQYLSANSGYSNAYTASCDTNYYFEVAAGTAELPEDSTHANGAKYSQSLATTLKETSPLYGALDRFAQFFISPLFLRETLDRELHAVDSENKKNLQSDPWRLSQLAKAVSSPEHPYHHFSTGNLQTLRDDPKEHS